MDWLIKELVDKNILQLPSHVKVADFVGHYKIIDGVEQKSNGMVHCNTLQHTATHCNTLQHIATHWYTLQRTAAHCNTLQHTAPHYGVAMISRLLKIIGLFCKI